MTASQRATQGHRGGCPDLLVRWRQKMADIERRSQAEAAIDGERLTADPGRILGAQKGHNTGDVVWCADPLHGGVGDDVFC